MLDERMRRGGLAGVVVVLAGCGLTLDVDPSNGSGRDASGEGDAGELDGRMRDGAFDTRADGPRADGARDGSIDAALDAEPMNDADADPPTDAAIDAEPPDGDAMNEDDAELDADADMDAATDADTDADASNPADADATPPPDADADADAPPPDDADADANPSDDGGGVVPVTLAIFPWNGYATGTALASRGLQVKFRWSGVPGATYSFQLDDSCDPLAFESCTFPSPVASVTSHSDTSIDVSMTVPAAVPVGRRLFWRVRACASTTCGPWDRVRYVDLGRQREDFNGDGYADIVVGSPLQDAPETDEGNVFVYYGRPGGAFNTPTTTLDNPFDTTSTGFGSAVEAGDFNADGFGDLAVGAPGAARFGGAIGAVFIYSGSATGVSATPSAILDNPAFDSASDFGGALAGGGDIDGDGFGDLVVGAPWQPGGGGAYVYFGGPSGLAASPAASLTAGVATSSAFGFGTQIASNVDTDGDGFVDILVGAPYRDGVAAMEGTVYLFRGGSSGTSATPIAIASPGHLELAQFGVAVSGADDLNQDGYGDFVVGAYNTRFTLDGEGAAYVFLGSQYGPGTMATIVSPAPRTTAHFGSAVAGVRDFNGDRIPDFVVGSFKAASPETEEGNAWIYYGTIGGVPLTPTVTLDSPRGVAGAWFGRAASIAGDVDADGFFDFVVGAPHESTPYTYEGGAHAYYGTSSGGMITPVAMSNPANQPGAEMGSSVR